MLINIAPVTVDVGPVRHVRPGTSTTQSPGGHWLSRMTSATSISLRPEEWAGFDCEQCATETIAMTGSPRDLAPNAISTMSGRMPDVEMTMKQSCGPNLKPDSSCSA